MPERRDSTPAPREYPRTFEPRPKNDVFQQIYETNPVDREFYKPNSEAAGNSTNQYTLSNALISSGNNFQYPSELGSNEYNHFVMFSIYQGQSINLSSESVEAADDATMWGSDPSVIGYNPAGGFRNEGVVAAEDAESQRYTDMFESGQSRDSGGVGQSTTTYRAGGRGSGRGQSARRSTIQQTRINPAKVRMMETVALYMPQKLNQLGILDYDIESTTGAAIVKDLANADLSALAGFGAGAANAATRFLDGVAQAFGIEDSGFNPALRASLRVTSNPRRELVFNQPQPRKFEFNFEFAPRNQEETQLINEIIRVFKFHSYPYLQNNGYFYEMPAEFHIKYYHVTENGATIENTFLNRIGACACTEVNVDYTAAGVASFHKDGSPTHINLSLTFSEMEVLTQQHINEGF